MRCGLAGLLGQIASERVELSKAIFKARVRQAFVDNAIGVSGDDLCPGRNEIGMYLAHHLRVCEQGLS